MSSQPSGVEQIVRTLFEVKETFNLPDGGLEFQVSYGEATKDKFVELKSKVSADGYKVELTGSKDECALILRKSDERPKSQPRLPTVLALFTLASVVLSAILQQGVYRELVPSWPTYFPFLEFALAVMALLGAHELGQRLVGRARDAGHATSYLIPGVPFIPPYLPSLGIAASMRQAALNRDRLFDAVVAGPLSMLALALILFVVGDVTAVQSAVTFASTNLNNTTVNINPNLLQIAIGQALGPFAHPIASGYVAVSPVADGAFIGFILVFFSLLPMASFDGGLLVTTAWGARAAKAAGYLSIVALLAIDTYNYWALAVIVLILVGRPVQIKLQDEVSPLSASRRYLLMGLFLLAFLCLPIPKNLTTFPLP